MSEPVAATETPVEPEFNREYIRAMNEAEGKGAEPELESEAKPVDADAKPVEAERDDKGKFKAGKPRHDPHARVAEATAEAAQARRERDEARAELDRVRQSAVPPADARPDQPVAPPTPIQGALREPRWEDFENEPDALGAFIKATARYENIVSRATERAQAEFAKINDANKSRFEQAIRDDDELPALMDAADAALVKAGADPSAPFPAVMLEAIRTSEQGPQIARFLGSHPEETVQLARTVRGLGPDAATVVRLMLEAQVKASTPAPTAAITTGSAAALPRPLATPLNPVRTSREPAPERDPSELDFGREYIRKMNARERA